MFCPRCGQEQISVETRFCSRCGFPMGGVAALVANNGATELVVPAGKTESPRRRGMKKGIFFFLLSFFVVPIISMITIWLRAEPFLVAVASVIFVVGGLLRVAYAWLFEAGDSPSATPAAAFAMPNAIHRTSPASELPPATFEPAADFVPPERRDWRDTNDLQPVSVTDPTTRLLKEEK